jgi:hypothetical protein
MTSKMGHASDSMIRRLQKELMERDQAVKGIVETAQNAERDLNTAERETLGNLRGRMVELKSLVMIINQQVSSH